MRLVDDTGPDRKDGYQLKLAVTLDDLMLAVRARSSRFIARGEPFAEEFDGNDFSGASHLLLYRRAGGRETLVATMRVRFLHATTVAWERVCVLPSADARALPHLINGARRYCENKGMTRAIGVVANERFQAFLMKKGARMLDEVEALTYGGVAYAPMEIPLAPNASPPGNIEEIAETDFLSARPLSMA